MIDSQQAFLLGALFFAASILYSSVGHGGASGYLAAMGLFGIAPAVMRPTALVMNIAVASISLYKFTRSSGFNWRLFWPFAVTAVPMAFVGGRIQASHTLVRNLGGMRVAVLCYPAVHRTLVADKRVRRITGPPPIALALVLGAAIGLLSGLTGVGGGIFLSPLLVLTGWAAVRDSAAPTAAFVLVNSVSGLLGLLSRQPTLPDALPYWVAAVVIGGLIGASYGSRRLGNNAMRQALAAVLVIAGAKMIL